MPRVSFLILHGLENHRPPGHWQFWLAAALAEAGHDVRYPSLPDADTPSLAAWTSALKGQLGEMTAALESDLGTERVVICHSLACLLWLHAGPELTPDLRPDRVLLVSPPSADVLPATGAEFAVDATTLDPDAVQASARGSLRIVCTNADPYNPAGAEHSFAAPLGVDVDVLSAAGHITLDDGYGAWPSALTWATDPSHRLTSRD